MRNLRSDAALAELVTDRLARLRAESCDVAALIAEQHDRPALIREHDQMRREMFQRGHR